MAGTKHWLDPDRIASGYPVTASCAYTNTEITKSNDLELHKAPLNSPRNMANLWLDKTPYTGWWNNLGFGSGVRFMGKRWGDTYNPLELGLPTDARKWGKVCPVIVAQGTLPYRTAPKPW